MTPLGGPAAGPGSQPAAALARTSRVLLDCSLSESGDLQRHRPVLTFDHNCTPAWACNLHTVDIAVPLPFGRRRVIQHVADEFQTSDCGAAACALWADAAHRRMTCRSTTPGSSNTHGGYDAHNETGQMQRLMFEIMQWYVAKATAAQPSSDAESYHGRRDQVG